MFTLSGEGLHPAKEKGCHWATVIDSKELLTQPREGASTRLLTLNIQNVSAWSRLCALLILLEKKRVVQSSWEGGRVQTGGQ